MKNICLILIFILTSLNSIISQTTREEIYITPEKSAGIHYAYPFREINPQTPPPKGYKPFYISHFGRHGSRFLISDNDYKTPLELFKEADEQNALTPLGKDVYDRLIRVWEETEDHGGDLSPLGVREHRGIAERMYKNFPEVFENNSPVTASSTMVVRCVLSMDAFCERLKELNPTLQTNRQANEKTARILNHHTKESNTFRSGSKFREPYRKFEEKHVKPDRLISTLFSDEDFIYRRVNPKEIMWSLYNIAGGMQNIEADLTFYDIFEKEELFDLWQCGNYRSYERYSGVTINEGVLMEDPKPVVREMIKLANEAIDKNTKGASLRFAHDGNIMPLTLFLHLEGCHKSISDPTKYYTAFSNFKVSPMGANVQMIFFRKKNSEDILVKILHNENETRIPVETDIFPYYHWKDVEKFYTDLLNKHF